jgi:hypothetical protein
MIRHLVKMKMMKNNIKTLNFMKAIKKDKTIRNNKFIALRRKK